MLELNGQTFYILAFVVIIVMAIQYGGYLVMRKNILHDVNKKLYGSMHGQTRERLGSQRHNTDDGTFDMETRSDIDSYVNPLDNGYNTNNDKNDNNHNNYNNDNGDNNEDHNEE